jgi:hypothetical protein
MKKIALLMALLVISQGFAFANGTQEAVPTTGNKVNYERPYYNKPAVSQNQRVNYAPKNSKVYKPASDNHYILKYNIDDLESAPWINGGKRKI